MRLPKHEELLDLLKFIYYYASSGFHHKSSFCLLPCTLLSAKAKYEHIKARKRGDNEVYLYFEENIEVGMVVYAYDFGSLLIEMSSSLGLWLGMSVLGLFDILVLTALKMKRLYVKAIRMLNEEVGSL